MMKLVVQCKNGHDNEIEIDDEDIADLEDDDEFELNEYCTSCGSLLEIDDLSILLCPGTSSNGDETGGTTGGTIDDPIEIQRLKWRYPIEPASKEWQPLRNCPAIDADGHVIACHQNEIVSLGIDEEELRVLWTYATGAYIPGSPTIGLDGNIRVHSTDGCLYCLTTAGELCWSPVAVGEPLGWAAPITDLESNTWICSYGGGLVRIDAQGQTDRRPFLRSPTKFDSTGVILNEMFYVGAEDQFLHAIQLSGRRGRECWDADEDRGRTGWFINSAPIVLSDSTIVVASRDDHLYGFNLQGELCWNMKPPGQILTSPVADKDDRLYVGLSEIHQNQPSRGSLACINSRSQKIQWVYSVEAAVESTPVIGDDGVIYFGDNGGTFHAVDQSGNAVWTERVGSAIRSPATIPREGQVVIGLDDGSLLALECGATGLADGWPKYLKTKQQMGVVMDSEIDVPEPL